MSRGRPGPRAVGNIPADQVDSLIEQCMLIDQPRLRRWWRDIARGGQPASSAATELENALEQSARRARQRTEDRPALAFPEQLPISARRDELAAVISRHQAVVVCGETGSGKSTQLPKICLAVGRGRLGTIGHTQPRRIAARAVASRIAEELGEPLGGRVGYKIRFRDRTGERCRIKLMTDGILLAELQHDRWLRQYDTLIIDEAHERSLNIDFLLGFLKQLISRRADLKLLITSATIDPQRLSDHFGKAPVVQVSGRTWPVETRYRSLAEEGDEAGARTQAQAILAAVDELCAESARGDILIFLAGERDIRETADALRKHHPPDTEILPLFSRLSNAEQDRVFQPSPRRRIVLATNIAETSLTVPGIRYVVDTGRARISRYSYRSKIQRLQIETVARASAEQRKGRCGREREGVCIRLFSEEDFDNRPPYTDPEILRTSLASVILQMEALGLGAIEAFPFVDPPDRRFVKDGYRLLGELEAVDGDNRITGLGRRLSRYPVDPRLARALLAAGERECLREMLPIAAFLSIQDPRDRPVDKTAAADECHQRWQVPGSDLLGVVRLWDDYLERRRHLSVNKQRRWCRDNFLSFVRMREWHDVHQQLHARLRTDGLTFNTEAASAEAIHRAFLHGFLGHIGQHHENGRYDGPRGAQFHIGPGSVLAGRTPGWVVAASLVQTRRGDARHGAQIQAKWIEGAAGHLVRRRYESPRWHRRRGHVVARETVALYGLVLASGRRVDYGSIDPVESRRIFIREALVDDQLDLRASFRTHNRAVLAQVTDIEARLRRRDLLAAPADLAGFFEDRLAEDICTQRQLRRWLRGSDSAGAERLCMSIDDVLATDVPQYHADDYPDVLEIGGNRYPLSYRYAVGETDDGVTLSIVQTRLGALDAGRLEWLIPGWLPDKVVAMIRALPKSLRRRLVPAPDVARRCLPSLSSATGDLLESLAAVLQREAGVPVSLDTLRDVELPDYLAINIRVVDDDERMVGQGRDLARLQRQFQIHGPLADSDRRGTDSKELIRRWSFDTLPPTAALVDKGREQRVHVGLHDEGDGVSVRHFASAAEAATAHRLGTLRLFRLACASQERYLRKELARRPALRVAVGVGGDIVGDLIEVAARDVFVEENTPAVRDAAVFEARMEAGRGNLITRANALADLTTTILESWRTARVRLDEGPRGHGAKAAVADIRAQLDGLVYDGFVHETPAEWLTQLPRYLQAVHTRLDRLESGDRRDSQLAAAITVFQRRLDERRGQPGVAPSQALVIYRWMLEEYRVSLFAQNLGTAVKVSPQRLDRQWALVEQQP